MRWKIMQMPAKGSLEEARVQALGYPTRKSAVAAARRLSTVSASRFFVDKMTAEDEALANEMERNQ